MLNNHKEVLADAKAWEKAFRLLIEEREKKYYDFQWVLDTETNSESMDELRIAAARSLAPPVGTYESMGADISLVATAVVGGDEDPVARSPTLVEFKKRCDPRPFSLTEPLDASGDPIPLDLESVLANVERIMEGFEEDEGYQGELELAIAHLAPAVLAGAYARAASEEERQEPLYFVVGHDAMLESNADASRVRQLANWGWIDDRWAWIDARKNSETKGQFFREPYPEQYRQEGCQPRSPRQGHGEGISRHYT
ncbi:hypothetical protein PG991_014857 [Apiospora marii]|uniref:Uncharacterized protein n=1 Tax=Apiospora marii TaxID=335849 RepID=A0ABR1R4N9_9PEZI